MDCRKDKEYIDKVSSRVDSAALCSSRLQIRKRYYRKQTDNASPRVSFAATQIDAAELLTEFVRDTNEADIARSKASFAAIIKIID